MSLFLFHLCILSRQKTGKRKPKKAKSRDIFKLLKTEIVVLLLAIIIYGLERSIYCLNYLLVSIIVFCFINYS
jgi:hypothetical protein